jgi:hypothetical protein
VAGVALMALDMLLDKHGQTTATETPPASASREP